MMSPYRVIDDETADDVCADAIDGDCDGDDYDDCEKEDNDVAHSCTRFPCYLGMEITE